MRRMPFGVRLFWARLRAWPEGDIFDETGQPACWSKRVLEVWRENLIRFIAGGRSIVMNVEITPVPNSKCVVIRMRGLRDGIIVTGNWVEGQPDGPTWQFERPEWKA